MADRRSFLGAVSGVAASLVLASSADAQQAPPVPAGTAAPSPHASATPKPASAAARAQAETMRTFDAQLSDAQLEKIARGIDGLADEGRQLNPRGTRLKNGDEPVTRFGVEAHA